MRLRKTFMADNSCMGINLDGAAGNAVIVGSKRLRDWPTVRRFNSSVLIGHSG